MTHALLSLLLWLQDPDADQKKLDACAENLRRLQKAYVACAEKATDKKWIAATGCAFWLRLARTEPPMIDAKSLDVFSCPAAKEKAPKGRTHYRGPKKDANKLEDDDPLGCCEPGHHAGDRIVVIKKSGEVLALAKGKAGYKDALALTLGADEELVASCRHLIDNLTQALKHYELDSNAYPVGGNAEMVKALSSLGPKKLPYFEFTKDMLNEKGEVLDPWGRPLVYVNQAQNYPKNLEDKSAHNKTSFDLWSAGPDGNDDRGANDDPNNWD